MKECICKLKKEEEKHISHGDWTDLYISLKLGEYYIEAIGDGRASLKINYCPICGRRLEN